MNSKIKFLPTEAEREKAVYQKGVEISKWSDWDVNVITDTFLEALEDSNAHTLRGRIDATIEDYWKTVRGRIDATIEDYWKTVQEQVKVRDEKLT